MRAAPKHPYCLHLNLLLLSCGQEPGHAVGMVVQPWVRSSLPGDPKDIREGP